MSEEYFSGDMVNPPDASSAFATSSTAAAPAGMVNPPSPSFSPVGSTIDPSILNYLQMLGINPQSMGGEQAAPSAAVGQPAMGVAAPAGTPQGSFAPFLGLGITGQKSQTPVGIAPMGAPAGQIYQPPPQPQQQQKKSGGGGMGGILGGGMF